MCKCAYHDVHTRSIHKDAPTEVIRPLLTIVIVLDV